MKNVIKRLSAVAAVLVLVACTPKADETATDTAAPAVPATPAPAATDTAAMSDSAMKADSAAKADTTKK